LEQVVVTVMLGQELLFFFFNFKSRGVMHLNQYAVGQDMQCS